jgi:hypothetical protein
MKKAILILTFLFISFNALAQKQFEGMWVSKESSYINTIISSKYKVLKVFNFSFEQDKFTPEVILSQSKNEFNTRLVNERNGFTVEINYRIEKDTLVCAYSGHYNGIIKLTKIKQ